MNSNSDDIPFWPDSIEKYFSRPRGQEFELLKYQEYFESYEISTSRIITPRIVFRDEIGNYVVKRKTKIITRIRYLRLEHGELYFYQQLLLRLTCRSEEELKGNFATYRQHFLFKFPEVYQAEQVLYKSNNKNRID